MLAGGVAVIDRLDRAALILFDSAALAHPVGARAGKALLDVDRGRVIGVGAGGIVDRERRLAPGGAERDLAQRHAQVWRSFGTRVDLARSGDRAGRHLRRGEIGFGDMLVHRSLLSSDPDTGEPGAVFAASFRPFAG